MTSQLNILHNFKSKNFNVRKKQVSFIILHYTETKNLDQAVKLLTANERRVSCHFLIDTNGNTYNLVCETKRAWHAGVSSWKGLDDINSRSIGIEIVNSGEENNDKFPQIQIDKLIILIRYLCKKFVIPQQNILGHSDIAPLRKIDPGRFFPWKKLHENQIGLWTENYISDSPLNISDYKLFLNNLKNYGYPYINLTVGEKENRHVINSFHRHFIPDLVGKKPTLTSLKRSNDLLKLKSS